MNLRMAKSGDRRGKLRLLGLFGLLVAATGLVLTAGEQQQPTMTRHIGDDHIVSWQPISEMCPIEPASATQTLRAALQTQTAMADRPQPSASLKDEVRQRRPASILKDPLSAYAGVAVDPIRNEVVFADENLFSIHVFDRMENTPPNAKMSEPKRIIQGENTFLEFTCSVYVDPASGEIYGINNDTLNWMPVFAPGAKGDAAPIRKLATPHTTFGLVADEATQELFMTIQDDQAVVVFKKNAKDTDPAVRTLQGPKTLMADPHGLAINPKDNLIYVSNWGTANSRIMQDEERAKRNFPVGRNQNIPASGRIEEPSITVYPKDAKGDTAPLRIIRGPKTQLSWPTALAVHPDRGEIFVANDSGDSVIVFKEDANGDVAPIRVIKGPRTLVKNPTGVAVDLKNNELWVANFGTHAATVFPIDAGGNVAPKRVIRSGPLDAATPMIGNPHTVAYDSKRDEVLVSNCVAHPQIAAFARLSAGGPKPTRAIAGQNTNIARTIHDMAYDPIHDEIVVPQFFAFGVLFFKGDANGNVPPVRKIFGPSTQIKNPDSVALDAVHGEVFIPQDGQILVFSRETNGDSAPIRILKTSNPDPARITIDPVHDLMIVSGGPMVRIWDRKASGNTPPKSVITIPKSFFPQSGGGGGGGGVGTSLMANDPASGMIFAAVRVGGRFALEDFIGVWSINDKGEVPPRFTIGGPNSILKDVRGVAVDAKNKGIIISDKTLNSIMTFHVPEVFQQ